MSLLTCRLNSTSANYEASTKTAQIHKNETLNRQNKNSVAAAGRTKQYEPSTGTKPKPLILKKKNTQIDQKRLQIR